VIAYLVHALQSVRNDDRGATAVEYALMVSLIAAVIVVAVGALGTGLSGMFDDVLASIT
jgi:pilus assembly protein Flp/PilA